MTLTSSTQQYLHERILNDYPNSLKIPQWIKYLYNVEKLKTYSNLDKEHQKVKDLKTNWRNVARKIMVALTLSLLFATSYIYKPIELLVYFTNWTAILQVISLITTIKAASNPGFERNIKL